MSAVTSHTPVMKSREIGSASQEQVEKELECSHVTHTCHGEYTIF